MKSFVTAVPSSRRTKITKVLYCSKEENTKKISKSTEQLFIDFGQKSFGATLHCSSCGMLFVIGDKADEKRHEAYCKSHYAFPTLTSWKGFEKIGQGTNDNDCILFQRSISSSISTLPGLRDVFSLMIVDLGFSTDFLCKINNKGIMILLYCRLKTIIGCILVEEVPAQNTCQRSGISATPVFKYCENENFQRESKRQRNDEKLQSIPLMSSVEVPNTGELDTSQSPETSTASTNTEYQEISVNSASPSLQDIRETSRAEHEDGNGTYIGEGVSVVGIRVLWVHKDHRRQRVAHQLLDSARQHLSFGRVFPRRMVAISDPTDDGAAFLSKYLDGEAPLLVYSPVISSPSSSSCQL